MQISEGIFEQSVEVSVPQVAEQFCTRCTEHFVTVPVPHNSERIFEQIVEVSVPHVTEQFVASCVAVPCSQSFEVP